MSSVWLFVLNQYRSDRLHFWLGMLVAILPAAAGMLLLGVSGWFITAAAIAGLSGVFLNIFAPSAIIRALAIIRTAGRYGERVLTHDATFRFLTDLRNRMFAAYSNRQAVGHRSALLLNRLTLDITMLDAVYLRLVVPLFLVSVVAICLLVFWATTSGAMLIAGVVFLGAWAILTWATFARADNKTARRVDAASDAIRLRAADLAAGRRDLAIYGGLEEAAQRVLEADDRLEAAEALEDQRIIRLTGASLFIGQCFLAVTLVVCVLTASAGAISVPLAIGLLLVVMALPEIMGLSLPGLAKLPRTAMAATRAMPAQPVHDEEAKRFQVTGEREALSEAEDAVLKFDGVSFCYPGASRNVLENLSLSIKTREIVGIAGRSGCGKSTVAALASRLRIPDTGHILLKGRELGQIDEADLRKSITVLGQRPYIFNDTVAANLQIADPAASDEVLWDALEKAALAERVSRNPTGLNTILGEGGLGLSGGEVRRLALARAFLTNPDLFILDEMTEGLDEKTARDVLSRFLELRGQASVLMIAHKKLELSTADRIIQLQDNPKVPD